MTRRTWRPSAVSWTIVTLGLLGLGTLVYTPAAQWLSSQNQASLIRSHATSAAEPGGDTAAVRVAAERYNDALTSGVVLPEHETVPAGTGTSSDSTLAYDQQLRVGESRLMARLRYPAVGVDLPVYHGTDDETLAEGAGHLEGSSLPIGGRQTHAVITAHRGLAEATMFTNLDRAEVGDTFVIEVLGEALTYRVRETRVVAPEEREILRVSPGEDLVTLVTCTPLGINSHRILVTAERVLPTPVADSQNVGTPSEIPGPPYWLFGLGLGGLVLGLLLWRTGRTDGHRPSEQRGSAYSGATKTGVDDP